MSRTDLLLGGIVLGVGYLVVVDVLDEIQYRADRKKWKKALADWHSQPLTVLS